MMSAFRNSSPTSNNSQKIDCSNNEDKKFLYIQPPRRHPITYSKTYRKPTCQIESKSTYGLSYMKLMPVPIPRKDYGKCNRSEIKNTGQYDFDTIYKLSYKALNGKLARPFIPKSCLAINGSHDMMSVHMMSYSHPRYSKIKPFKPLQGKISIPQPMECETVTKKSYQNFGIPIIIRKPRTRQFWQTKFKTDYRTTSQLSYEGKVSIVKRVPHVTVCWPHISADMEKNTVYGTSYQVPGHFIKKEC